MIIEAGDGDREVAELPKGSKSFPEERAYGGILTRKL